MKKKVTGSDLERKKNFLVRDEKGQRKGVNGRTGGVKRKSASKKKN